MLNNFVNFELLFTKLSGIHPYQNALNNQVGMLGDMFLWLVANLKQGVIYFIKQGGGNHKIASVYLCQKLDGQFLLLYLTGRPGARNL